MDSNIKVQYKDLMADKDTEYMTVTLDELFLTVLSTNKEMFDDSYVTQDIVNRMLEMEPGIIDLISTQYKLELIESWDYEIADILDQNNESIKETINREIENKLLIITNNNQFEVLKSLKKKENSMNKELFDKILLCFLGVGRYNGVVRALNDFAYMIIRDSYIEAQMK